MGKIKQILSNPKTPGVIVGTLIFYGSLAALIWSAGWVVGLAVFLMFCSNNYERADKSRAA